jgi:hypothetical protein
MPGTTYPYAMLSNGTHGGSGVLQQVSRNDSADGAYWTFLSSAPVTFEAWIYLPTAIWPSNPATFPTLPIMSVGAGAGGGLLLYTVGGGYPPASGYQRLLWGNAIGGLTLNFDQWIHVAATRDGTTDRIYYNAAHEGSAPTASMSATTVQVHVGGHFFTGSSTSESFNGRIAHVAIYNVALTAAQLENHIAGA